MSKRNLRRITLQSGCTDRMGRPIDGIFEVLLDQDDLVDQMARAYENKSRTSCDGPCVVTYRPANKATADFLVNGEAFGRKVGPAKRDPRMDPAVGDVVLAHGKERTIHCLYDGGKYGWATESPISSGIVTLSAWREWARDGEVILAWEENQ